MMDGPNFIFDQQGSGVRVDRIASWQPRSDCVTWPDEWRREKERDPEAAEICTHTEVLLLGGMTRTLALDPDEFRRILHMALGI